MNRQHHNQIQIYAQRTIFILLDSTIIYFILKNLLKKDHQLKIFILAFTISFISTFLFDLQELKLLQKNPQYIDQVIMVFMIGIHFYIFAIGFILAGLWIIKKMIKDEDLKENIKIYSKLFIIIFSLIFAGVFFLFSIFIIQVDKIIKENNFWISVGVLMTSFTTLVCFSRKILKESTSQAVKRKIFHIGPILIVPVISLFNMKLLTLFLWVAFSVFFLLQVIRYQQQELDEENIEINIFLQQILGQLNNVYNWMRQFNKRQKHFWFTHLFLILSLLVSYQLPQLISAKVKISSHIVLVLIAADACAALIGTNYGRIKIYEKKTLEGTAAFIMICFIGGCFLTALNTTQLAIISVMCGLAQLFGGDTDNIVTLLTFYGLRFSFLLIIKLKRYIL